MKFEDAFVPAISQPQSPDWNVHELLSSFFFMCKRHVTDGNKQYPETMLTTAALSPHFASYSESCSNCK